MTSSPRLPYGRQTIDEADIAAVVEALRGERLTTGPAVDAFERAFAARVGAPRAVACSNGTAALHLAMLALEAGPGDAVIVPTLTFLATANCARYVGAEVVFADVSPDTGLMKPHHLEQALARVPAGLRPVAALPVHLNGQPVDMAGIAAVARANGLHLVEDACHALGTLGPDGDTVGACHTSDMAVFSLHPVKTITAGEGGVVTTRDDRLADRLRSLRCHGMERDPSRLLQPDLAFDDGRVNPWYYEMAEPGFNYRLPDINCALALSQLGKLDAFIARRSQLMARYARTLAGMAPVVRLIDQVAGAQTGWHLCVAHIDFEAAGLTRRQVFEALAQRGIDVQVHYLPVHMQPYYRRRYGELELPGALQYYRQCLSLPLFPAMADGDVDRVAAALAEILGLPAP
jgi:UDP-4-amino-4,6-dideoxy-N-acetyl-beta-L-altrosamine transaminase